jgi:hypothetical protein
MFFLPGGSSVSSSSGTESTEWELNEKLKKYYILIRQVDLFKKKTCAESINECYLDTPDCCSVYKHDLRNKEIRLWFGFDKSTKNTTADALQNNGH